MWFAWFFQYPLQPQKIHKSVCVVRVVLSKPTPTTKINKLVNMVSVVLPKPTPTTKSISRSVWFSWFFQKLTLTWSIWFFGIRGYVGEKMPATCFAVSRNGTGRDEQAAFGITTCLVRVEEEAFAVKLRRDCAWLHNLFKRRAAAEYELPKQRRIARQNSSAKRRASGESIRLKQ